MKNSYTISRRKFLELFGCGCGVTHLFNAMSGLHHRDPGVASAALSNAEYAEIICDDVHVTEPAFQLARGRIPQLYSVTDSTSAAGMPDGEYQLGTNKVYKKNESVTLRDGTLAGSAATADLVVKTLRKFGLDWVEIGLMTSTRPANWLGLDNVGQIAPGALGVRPGRKHSSGPRLARLDRGDLPGGRRGRCAAAIAAV